MHACRRPQPAVTHSTLPHLLDSGCEARNVFRVQWLLCFYKLCQAGSKRAVLTVRVDVGR